VSKKLKAAHEIDGLKKIKVKKSVEGEFHRLFKMGRGALPIEKVLGRWRLNVSAAKVLETAFADEADAVMNFLNDLLNQRGSESEFRPLFWSLATEEGRKMLLETIECLKEAPKAEVKPAEPKKKKAPIIPKWATRRETPFSKLNSMRDKLPHGENIEIRNLRKKVAEYKEERDRYLSLLTASKKLIQWWVSREADGEEIFPRGKKIEEKILDLERNFPVSGEEKFIETFGKPVLAYIAEKSLSKKKAFAAQKAKEAEMEEHLNPPKDIELLKLEKEILELKMKMMEMENPSSSLRNKKKQSELLKLGLFE